MLNVSTKTGDDGQSSLADGTRLSKDHLVFEVIGTIDELNSHLGLAVALLKKLKSKKIMTQTDFLETIQHELFTLGAKVAGAKLKISQEFLDKIEKTSTDLQTSMAPNWHHQFVLPGGHEAAAQVDIARSVCRKLERRIVSLSKKRTISEQILQTINRLSDYLYVLRCFINQALDQKEKYFIRSEKVHH
ncbi:MAG: ATP:cob(I)alamin adenosyltransferase [Candidatus Pacebacteria bacterium RIFOXYB1_FULL_39_46]|nr:MAG: ATP:cob(I)alamin adenosyltransferase [Candidatus Pacebacteria bacterium RIFOXYB1_FULL_39_46]OGJ39316.1 MAG: ATP:cob(I)alamin adenosyltransferase [Candidatus Pacebacteria bacterium RIFOXYA1_FULL_38_18]OGJ40953.1 MAG: ATP:cob(I)alamin adenosyltransferase [Candidatus Pacebacteria bacterium RIFOXYD1_FULL_39_27]OGJ41175.1 MAG: ATP:cob(I)alamin adenosyltransferase [Candidatus Pacebacteria bacterium RIFOXYC1_FULL_39_21]